MDLSPAATLTTSPPAAPPARPRVGFLRDLAAHGDQPAVLGAEGRLTYAELAARVQQVADRLGPERRLVLVAASNTTAGLVDYLGALTGGHPVLLVPGDRGEELGALVAAYDPDVVLGAAGSGSWQERRAGTRHELHPDLALLLSTSGTTGSPKLVRLSHQNLQANAQSVAEVLGVRRSDRAATTLPMSYCYGLSVIHSHLLLGAALILTDRSVVDPCFWREFREHRGTSFAGVPYTFDLLDRVGFADMSLPDLRYVTQAGGRLAPERVRRYAELGQRGGWDLFVMYGQTEATARMACLPPAMALSHPEAIGRPIPGGAFSLEPFEGAAPGTGELVYRGPNVMMGYAESPADLGLGPTVGALRTGDVACRAGDGLYEVVGRRGRTAKVFGLRVDLGHVEALLGRHGIEGWCVADGEELVVTVLDGAGADDARVRELTAGACGLPRGSVRARRCADLPRLASGKPDYRALAALASSPPAPAPRPSADPSAPRTDLVRLFGEVLGRDDVGPQDTFVGLGGDSLSYVEMSLRVEESLGHLPGDWHTTPIGALASPSGPPARPAIETSVALRAAAIVAIVANHADLFKVVGGAHVLLGVAGYNVARFHLTGADRRERRTSLLASTRRLAVPSVVWIAGAYALTDGYQLANVLLLNSFFGPDALSRPWAFWFLETLVYTLLALVAVLGLPAVDRWERRAPFGFALALLGVGLLARFGLLGADSSPDRVYTAPVVLWLFALGWAAARARTVWHRLLLTAVVLGATPGFLYGARREGVVAVGLLLLVWTSTLPCPRWVHPVAGVLASSSLYVYLTHFEVFPHLADRPLLAVLASLGVGIAYWQATVRLRGLLRRHPDG